MASSWGKCRSSFESIPQKASQPREDMQSGRCDRPGLRRSLDSASHCEFRHHSIRDNCNVLPPMTGDTNPKHYEESIIIHTSISYFSQVWKCLRIGKEWLNRVQLIQSRFPCYVAFVIFEVLNHGQGQRVFDLARFCQGKSIVDQRRPVLNIYWHDKSKSDSFVWHITCTLPRTSWFCFKISLNSSHCSNG